MAGGQCKVCTTQEGGGVGIGKARAGVLSVDTSGPLTKGKDVDGGWARFMLVGAFTWIAPKDLGEDTQEEPLREGKDKEEEQPEDQEEEKTPKRERGRPRKVEIREDDEQMG